jgi:hypothetical protein
MPADKLDRKSFERRTPLKGSQRPIEVIRSHTLIIPCPQAVQLSQIGRDRPHRCFTDILPRAAPPGPPPPAHLTDTPLP